MLRIYLYLRTYYIQIVNVKVMDEWRPWGTTQSDDWPRLLSPTHCLSSELCTLARLYCDSWVTPELRRVKPVYSQRARPRRKGINWVRRVIKPCGLIVSRNVFFSFYRASYVLTSSTADAPSGVLWNERFENILLQSVLFCLRIDWSAPSDCNSKCELYLTFLPNCAVGSQTSGRAAILLRTQPP